MAGPDLPETPAPLKAIQPYLKIASEHDQRDIVVSYWCRLYALQTGLKLSTKTGEETNFLLKLMDWLETTKKANQENEAITNDVAAQAHVENWALKLFLYADKHDRASNFGKNVIQSFYTAGLLYDVLAVFGELSDEVIQNRKYAKWKAAYIHNCLKNGETPQPGPAKEENDDDSNENVNNDTADYEDNEDNENMQDYAGMSQPSQPGMPTYPMMPMQPTVPSTPPTNMGAFGFPSVPGHDDDENNENENIAESEDKENENPAAENEDNENNEDENPAAENEDNENNENENPAAENEDNENNEDENPAVENEDNETNENENPAENEDNENKEDENPAVENEDNETNENENPAAETEENKDENNENSEPHPYNPAPTPTNPGTNSMSSFDNPASTLTAEGGVELSVDQSAKAAKYIKWAGSALNYDDVPTTITNLRKALQLLTTGEDPV